MVATPSYNYFSTTNAAGTFNATSVGGVQGMFIDDPAVRYQLKGGILASTETLPMWGGVGINVTTTPNAGYTNATSGVTTAGASAQGGLVTRATNITAGATGQLVGFSVFNQAYGMVSNPQSPVPLAGTYMQVNYFLLGTNARMYVAAAASLTSMEGVSVGQAVSWDFVNQQLIPYIPAYVAVTAGGITAATYTSSTGILALTFTTAPFGASMTTGANGAYINVAGLTQTGTAVVNGSFPITGVATSGTVVSVQTAAGAGASTLTASGATLAAGGGALPVIVEDILAGNSMTVSYNATTNVATWSYTGTLAIIVL